MLLTATRINLGRLPIDLLAPILASRHPCSFRLLSTSDDHRPSFIYEYGVAFLGKPAYRPAKDAPKIRTLPDSSPIKSWVKNGNAEMGRFLPNDKEGAKKITGGDDWYFVARPGGEELVLGLSDGVGGWSESNIDPSIFSQALMWHSKEAVEQEGALDPKKILRAGYDGVQEDSDVVAGSSTALVMSLSPNGRVRAANLGDSSFHLLRRPTPSEPHQIIHSQIPQTYFFNAPYQLAKYPKQMNTNKSLINFPEQADEWEKQLKADDLLILTTDGYSDNIFPRETQHLIQEQLTEAEKNPALYKEYDLSLADLVAFTLLRVAAMVMHREDIQTPFEQEARANRIFDMKGGKVDDCLVIVVRVIEKER